MPTENAWTEKLEAQQKEINRLMKQNASLVGALRDIGELNPWCQYSSNILGKVEPLKPYSWYGDRIAEIVETTLKEVSR